MESVVSVREATAGDTAILGEYGAALAQQHRSYDPKRFVVPAGGSVAFEEFFRRELSSTDSLILVAETGGRPAGYAFFRREPASLVALSEEAFWLHDIYLNPSSRGRGIGPALLAAGLERIRLRGANKLMLSVSPENPTAAAAFRKAGFRVTMLEMQLDVEVSGAGTNMPHNSTGVIS